MSDEQPTGPVGSGAPWWSRPSDDAWTAPPASGGDPYSPAGRATAPLPGWQQPAAFGPPPRQRGRGWLLVTIAAVALVSGLIGAAIGAAVGVRSDRGSLAGTTRVSLGQTQSSQRLVPPPGSVAAIANKVLPSVVSINVRSGTQGDTGSGVVLSTDGYILTNNHVVAAASGGGTITVVFYSKQTVPARVVGTDPKSDLAVIKAQGVTGLRKADLGSSSSLQVGDLVVAIGSPLGLTGTVTSGIVSAKNRPVRTDGEGGQSPVIDAIQTDAAINPGNSGGALVDASGAVVGINSAIATVGSGSLFGGGQSGNIGVGFAIPIDQARSIAAELIRTGHATHPRIGVSAEDVDENRAKQIPGGKPGALVRDVVSGSGAGKAGIAAGDIITNVAGKRITSVDELVVEIRKHQVGDAVKVTFVRKGRERTVSVTLGSDSG